MTFPQIAGAMGLAICLTISYVSEPARAAAIDLNQVDFEYDGSPWTLGWRFTVNDPIYADSLGVYDSGQDGLAGTAPVGLWLASGGDPLTQTTVPAGTAGALDGHFRFAPITPTLLTPGTEYVVGSYLSRDLTTALFGGNGIIDPRVNVIDARYSTLGTGFAFPDQTDLGAKGAAFLGGNFQLTPVPLPAAPWLLGSEIAGLAALARRRRSSSRRHWSSVFSTTRNPMTRKSVAGTLVVLSVLSASALQALTGDGTIPRVPNPPLASDLANLPGDLRAVPVPGPSDQDLAEYVKDKQMAIALGKAFFWDMQVGSDGVTACASCHFRAGADPRSKNQLSPGLKHVPQPDLTFKTGGPNYQLTGSEFPLTRLAIAGQRGALDQATDSNDVVSSQGVAFLDRGPDPLGYQVGRLKTRRVEPRNTPTVINAVFYHRQFWDGRAENVFNGVNHLGARDPEARVMASVGGTLIEVPVALVNSSLASQAVAPIVSDLEMAAPGRTVQDVARDLRKGKHSRRLGRRVHGSRPLQQQLVDPSDSVLGPLSRYPEKGLRVNSYDDMIQAAFQNKYWESNKLIQVAEDGSVSVVDRRDRNPNTDEYTLLEYNFALFFGLAVQLYEATLVSDDTPWDRFRRDHPDPSDPALNPWTNEHPNHISRLALFGAHLFNDRTRGPNNLRCSNCHEGAELTDASVRRINLAANGPVRNRDGNIIDKGFNNIGVRPTEDDLGVGASDAFGPLSYSKRLFPNGPPANFDGAAVTKGFGVEGAFKVPSLRNVALTAPYFHNGDTHSLREAVLFYSRGGNVAPITQRDGTPIEPLGIANMTSDEVDAVVAWLEALTDERVRIAAAPFDHPQLFVPNGHPGDHTQVEGGKRGFAKDDLLEIPMTGAAGGPPLPGFLDGVFGPH